MRRKTLYLGAFLSVFLLLVGFSVSAQTETKKYSTATNLGLFGSYTWDIAVDATDNQNVYLATYYSPNGLFYSNDGGTTWSGLPATADHGAGRAVEVNPTTGTTYALLGDLLVSDDNFATYEVAYEFGSGGWDLLYAQSALFVTANDEIYKSTDDGENFTQTTICEDETVWSLASDGTSLYALCYNYDTEVSTLYESPDTGATWTNLDIASDGVAGAEIVEVNQFNNDLYLIPSSTGGTTYRSADSGATWSELASAPLTGNMSFDSTGRIYVGWYYSDDNGSNWTSFGTGGDYNHIIYVDPTDDTILYDTSVPGFQKSIDNGVTWTPSVENITGVGVTSMSQTTDKDTVWVATQNGPAKTSNFLSDEADWAYTEMDNFTSSGYDAVWVKPGNADTAVYSSSMALSYTTDGGTTWTASTVDITLTGAVFQIVNDSDGDLYAVIGPNVSTGSQTGGVITSDDDGATWTSLDFTSDKAARSISVASDGDIFVGAHSFSGGIYKYDGSSWTKLDISDDYEYRAVIVDPDDADTIYALSVEKGFYKSTDDGETWTKSNTGLGGVSNYTEFNALTVQTSSDPNTLYMSAVASSTTKGMIYKSVDGGDNWDKYYTGKKGETFNSLLFDGLMAGNSRGLFDMKTRPRLKVDSSKNKVAAGNQVKFTVTLIDKVSDEGLANRRVKLYRKIGKQAKKYWKTVRTNKNGKKVFRLSPKKKTIVYARWNRNAKNKEEFSATGLKSTTVKMK